MLLAIDTSTGSAVAAVGDDGVVHAERTEPDTRRHAEAIGSLIAGALADAGASAVDVTAVAVGMGPGPFTGLRVGIAAARAFARGRSVPLLAVVSHDAVAAEHAGPLVVVTDARRRELAWSQYAAAEAGMPVRLRGPELAPAADLDALLASAAPGAVRVDAALIPAGALGRIAVFRRAAGAEPGPDRPLYLRPPDVTVVAR